MATRCWCCRRKRIGKFGISKTSVYFLFLFVCYVYTLLYLTLFRKTLISYMTRMVYAPFSIQVCLIPRRGLRWFPSSSNRSEERRVGRACRARECVFRLHEHIRIAVVL